MTLTTPSCHQKFGTVKPKADQVLGAVCDQTSAVTTITSSTGIQAPWASTSHVFLQFTPNNHHASQARTSDQFRSRLKTSTASLKRISARANSKAESSRKTSGISTR